MRLSDALKAKRADRLDAMEKLARQAESEGRVFTADEGALWESLQRELAEGPALHEAHTARLAELGAEGDAALVEAIRNGEMDGRMGELLTTLRPSVEAALVKEMGTRFATGLRQGVSGSLCQPDQVARCTSCQAAEL